MSDNREGPTPPRFQKPPDPVRPTPPWFHKPPDDWAKGLAPSQPWMKPPDVPTILEPHKRPGAQPNSRLAPKSPAGPARRPEPPSVSKPEPIQIEGEPGTILLSCLGCDTPVRQLVIREVAQAVIRGAPVLPVSCQHCGVRYSDESQDRLRRFIYEHARSGHRGDVRFALYPVGWKRG